MYTNRCGILELGSLRYTLLVCGSHKHSPSELEAFVRPKNVFESMALKLEALPR
jgi:hypothetical protein